MLPAPHNGLLNMVAAYRLLQDLLGRLLYLQISHPSKVHKAPAPGSLPSFRGQRVMCCPLLTFIQSSFCLNIGSKWGEAVHPTPGPAFSFPCSGVFRTMIGCFPLSNMVRLLPKFPSEIQDEPGYPGLGGTSQPRGQSEYRQLQG